MGLGRLVMAEDQIMFRASIFPCFNNNPIKDTQ